MTATDTAVAGKLSTLDRFLPVWIGAAMVAGLLLGRVVPGLGDTLAAVELDGISLPIALGLLIMMYPVLAKVRYDRLDSVTGDRRLLLGSLALNWIIGPALMFALAWLLLPDLPEYRTGLIIVGFFLRAPAGGPPPAGATVEQTRRDHGPGEVLKSPSFWVMYVMFVMVGTGGLMATAQLAPIAKDFKVDGIPVSILGLTSPALQFALSIDRVLNGVTRPLFGWISDHIGRENTMFVAFLLEGIGIYALLNYAHDPFMFVILSGLVFFAWGEIYSLFPATCTDMFGRKYATANYGMLYTAKGTAALLVPLGNVLMTHTGNWTAVFIIAAALNIVAAVMALVVLKPMRRKAMEQG